VALLSYATLRDIKTGALVGARLPGELATRPFSAWEKAYFTHTKSEELDPVAVRKMLGQETFEEAWGVEADIAAANLKGELIKLGYSEDQIKIITSKTALPGSPAAEK